MAGMPKHHSYKGEFVHQQVIDDDICEECGLGKENRGHLFWECDAAREV